MKRCNNCFEDNSDGATNCVICGDSLDVAQIEDPMDAMGTQAEVSEHDAPGDDPESTLVGVAAEEATEDDALVRALDDEEPESVSNEDLPLVDIVDDEYGLTAEQIEDSVEELLVSIGTLIEEGGPVESSKGPVMTPVLEVFHDTEPRVVFSHAVVNDITLIGREDPHRDVFPDLDLGDLEGEGVSAKHVSRQHLRLLREGDHYFLFVHKGTTGTQVCDEMIEPARHGKRFEIQLGDRIILGGKVRMKLTTADTRVGLEQE